MTKWQAIKSNFPKLFPWRVHHTTERGPWLGGDTANVDELTGTRDQEMKKKVWRGYTVLILSDLTARARQVRLSRRSMGVILLGGTFAVLMIAYLLIHYIAFEMGRGEIERLRQTVNEQLILAEKMQALEQEVTRLRAVDYQIRRLAGMETGPEQESMVGIGGGTFELQQVLTAEEQSERQQVVQRLYGDLERLEREVALRAESLEALTTYMSEQKDRLGATPSLWPTKGYVTSSFGPRTSPFTGQRQQHSGIDIAAARGTSILSPADGVVTFSGKLPGYGNAIVITHGFGFKTFYGHNQENQVEKGQRVKRGQVIGTVGNSGYSTGSHLHYEVLVNNSPVDPQKYILDDERRAQAPRVN